MTRTLGLSQPEKHDHRDWYAVLGVEPSATFVEIRAAYRRHALALHADRLRSTERPRALGLAYDRLNELIKAYRTVRHPDSRRAYDLVREGHEASIPEPLRQNSAVTRRATSRAMQPGRRRRDRRRLGRIAVVLGFGLLVLWAVVTDIAERREAAAVLSNPPGIATTPFPER
jgi:curved DNA-binding protein CbpA